MDEAWQSLVPIAGGILLAWFTGGFRKYGSHLERLADLAAKMPKDTPARADLYRAVQDEAARLLSVPQPVRRASRLLGGLFLLYSPVLLFQFGLWRGLTPVEAVAYGFSTPVFLLLLWQVALVGDFYVPRKVAAARRTASSARRWMDRRRRRSPRGD